MVQIDKIIPTLSEKASTIALARDKRASVSGDVYISNYDNGSVQTVQVFEASNEQRPLSVRDTTFDGSGRPYKINVRRYRINHKSKK